MLLYGDSPGRPAAGRGGGAERPGRTFQFTSDSGNEEDSCCIQGLNVFVYKMSEIKRGRRQLNPFPPALCISSATLSLFPLLLHYFAC